MFNAMFKTKQKVEGRKSDMSTGPSAAATFSCGSCTRSPACNYFCEGRNLLGTVIMKINCMIRKQARLLGLHGDLSSSFLCVTFASGCFQCAQTDPRSLHVERESNPALN